MIVMSDLLTANKYLLAFPKVSLREKQGETERNEYSINPVPADVSSVRPFYEY